MGGGGVIGGRGNARACVGCGCAGDLPWQRQMKSRSIADGLQDYLSSPSNPTFNRQARYLLGFERVGCSEGRCCGICSHGNPGYPAYAYDFDANHDELLAKAKEALKSLRAFTLAECFPESMRAVAMSVGWNPDEAEAMARDVHMGVRKDGLQLWEMGTGFGSTDLPPQLKAVEGRGEMAWKTVLPPSMVDIIRKKNMVDVELIEFAKGLLYERHGIKC